MCNIWAVYKYRQYWLPFMSAVENHYFGALHSARKHCQPKRISQMPKTIDTVAFDGKIAYFLTWLVGIIFCPVNSNAGYNLNIRETKNMTPFDANSEHSIRRIKLYETETYEIRTREYSSWLDTAFICRRWKHQKHNSPSNSNLLSLAFKSNWSSVR